MRRFLVILALGWALLACDGSGVENGGSLPAVSEAWTTEAVFSQPQSVVFDAKRERLFVANVAGVPTEKDGVGFISRLDADGNPLELEWVAGLDAPMGLALHGDRLYAADIDRLVEIDADTGQILHRYPAPGAQLLNHVAISPQGEIFVSDLMGNAIYRLGREATLSIWIVDARLASPAGLASVDEALIAVGWGVRSGGFETTRGGHVYRIQLADRSLERLGPEAPLGNLLGLRADERGGLFMTEFTGGRLLYLTKSGQSLELATPGAGAADLAYLGASGLLVVPMMQDNRLKAYRIERPDR